MAQVAPEADYSQPRPLLLQYRQDVEEYLCIRAEDVVIDRTRDEACLILLSNSTGFTHHLESTLAAPPQLWLLSHLSITLQEHSP